MKPCHVYEATYIHIIYKTQKPVTQCIRYFTKLQYDYSFRYLRLKAPFFLCSFILVECTSR